MWVAGRKQVDSDFSFGGRNALLSRIFRRCLTERTGERLEDAFTDMMGFIAVYLAEMYVETAFNGYGTEELLKKLDLEITDHHMHSELCMIGEETAKLLNETKKNGGRIICVGTTSCRTLESLVKEDGTFEAGSKWTEIFIYPGYTFKAMDGLITNFHLPESTLVMLVSAFAGRDHVLHAYEEAVKERYRFFSFGDAMCIL